MLKIIQIEPQQSVGNEGFVDNVKNKVGELFAPGITKEKADEIFSGAYNKDRRNPAKGLRHIFDGSIFSDSWVASNLKGAKEKKPLASGKAFIAGVNEPNLSKLADVVAGPMLKVTQAVVKEFEGNTKLRLKLFAMIKEKAPEYADEVYEKYKDQLFSDPSVRWIKGGGKPVPGVGHSGTGEGGTWPVEKVFSKRDNAMHWTTFGYVNDKAPEGCVLSRPTMENYKEYAAAINKIFLALEQSRKLYDACYVDYWDGLEIDYNELHHGDDIFDKIATGQHDVLHDVPAGLADLCVDLLKEAYFSLVVK